MGNTVATCPVSDPRAIALPTLIATGATGAFTVTASAGAGTPAVFTERVAPASPRTFIVTRAADDTNNANCMAANGGCTLRQAVNASNANDPGAGAANTITFALDAPVALSGATGFGTLTPVRSVTVDATVPTHVVTISSNSTRLFQVGDGITLSLRGLTLAGPASPVNLGTAAGGINVDAGGALNVAGCVFSGNVVSGSDGGAISNSGAVNVTGSLFTGNLASPGGNGGAIAVAASGTLKVVNSTFFGNIATARLVGLIVPDPAPIMYPPPPMFYITAGGIGGAVANANSGIVEITGATFVNNTAVNAYPAHSPIGGAISNADTGALYLALSVVAGNSATVGPDISGLVADGGGNVVGIASGSMGLAAPNNRLGVIPLLGPLALNGATDGVQTFALLPGSPAIDIAACTPDPITGMALATDARGVSRPQSASGAGPLCDAGAFESRSFSVTARTGDGQRVLVHTAFGSPVGFTVTSGDNTPVSGGQIAFTITPGAGGASAAFGTASGCTVSAMNTVAVCTIGTGNGVTSPPFTANGTAGSFTIVATAPGVPPTTFTETAAVAAAPAATMDAYTVVTGTVFTVPATIGVLANDNVGFPTATLAVTRQPTHGMLALNTGDGSFIYTPTGAYTGPDSFQYTLTNNLGTSTGMVSLTVVAATVTSLTTTAPAANGGITPTLRLGGTLTLTTTATYNNGTSGTASPLMYVSSNPAVASVNPATGLVTALTPGMATITVTGPNSAQGTSVQTTITVTVPGAAGAGLMPNPQPMAHGAVPTAGATPLPQPVPHAASTASTANSKVAPNPRPQVRRPQPRTRNRVGTREGRFTTETPRA